MFEINSLRAQLKYFSLWWVMGCFLLISIVYLSLTSHPPKLLTGFSFGDKLGHFVAYTSLMLWFGQLYPRRQQLFLLVILFSSLGGLMEVLQWMGGVRFFEYFDMLANFIGVLFGWWLSQSWLRNLFVAIEKNIFTTGDS